MEGKSHLNPQVETAKKADESSKRILDGFEFGDPGSPFNPLDTTLAGGTHQGRNADIRGAWCEVNITAKDTAVTFTHNLNLPTNGTNERNVRYLYSNLRHDGNGLANVSPITTVTANTPRWSHITNTGTTGGINTTWAKLTFDTDVNTSGLTFDNANDRITNASGASITVLAQYHANTELASGTRSTLNMAIYLDGAIVNSSFNKTAVASAEVEAISGQAIITVANNSYLELYAQRSAGTGTLQINPYCSLSVVKLNDTSSSSSGTTYTYMPMSLEYVPGDSITANAIQLRLRAPGRTVSTDHPVRVTVFFTSAIRG